MKVLIVVDMQNDFIDGALGTKEAVAIVPNVIETIKGFEGTILYTKDTHFDDYMDTQEGKNLPVIHCVEETDGWLLNTEVADALGEYATVINKPTFGSTDLVALMREYVQQYRPYGDRRSLHRHLRRIERADRKGVLSRNAHHAGREVLCGRHTRNARCRHRHDAHVPDQRHQR